MNLPRLVAHELRFAHRHGILVLYVGLTAGYLTLLGLLLPELRPPVATYIVFTDPAAIGMAFMGAVVLLEKNQRVTLSLAVSPLPVWMYMAAKVIAFALIGSSVAAVLALYIPPSHRLPSVVGVALTSVAFSLMGMVIGAASTTLNGYMTQTIGPVLVITVPALGYLIGTITHPVWLAHPGIAALALIQGEHLIPACLSVLTWTVPLWFVAHRVVTKAWQTTELVTV